jgi:starch phosphorylase
VQDKRRPSIWRNAVDDPTKDSIKQDFVRHIQSGQAKDEYSATAHDRYQAICRTARDCLIERWVNTQQTYYHNDARRVYYLSLEYLMGRALHNALVNLDIVDLCRSALDELGYSLAELEELEVDAGLGNGGLGRLAACFLDSLATRGLPGYGYGLRYDFGIFRQAVVSGWQVEEADDWLRLPYPWELPRPEHLLTVRFGGNVEHVRDEKEGDRWRWTGGEEVLAMAYDIPIPGYGTNTVNTLRLWRARAPEGFSLSEFNVGDYIGSLEDRVKTESITRVLYPNDSFYEGKELRLKQQYLLVSATLQDGIRRHLVNHEDVTDLADKAVFQLNDTHPALAVAELMRLFLDDHGLTWNRAWEITQNSLAYTNHTLLPEALERWPTELVRRLLPRHGMIINEINYRFLADVRERFPGNDDLARAVSLFEEGDPQRIRMANLAVVGSYSVNGVAALHTELLKTQVMPELHQVFPEKFNNKTNGVTQRRWLLSCNPGLARLITDRIGTGWITDLDELQDLAPLATDPAFQEEFATIKRTNKQRLAQELAHRFDIQLPTDFIFDIQIKRIHEYKRQLLNALHVVHLYCRLRRDPSAMVNPRLFLVGGKAAPGYGRAKLVIKLVNDVAHRVNRTPDVADKLRLYFIPNYNVSLAEMLFPAADVSEQISTAGFEASGTGNMKFALNGAVTLGTLDGANVEIAEAVGKENIFIFGNTVEQVRTLRSTGYEPRRIYEESPDVREVLDLIGSGHFNESEPHLYQPIIDDLLNIDYYLHLADFASYCDAHHAVDAAFSDRWRIVPMMIANVAHVGRFSSDRTIKEYADEIWRVKQQTVHVE